MHDLSPETAVYLLGALIPIGLYLLMSSRRSRHDERRYQEAVASGLNEPASLHPSIDPELCFGCGACVTACPEGRILGLIGGKAQLVDASSCIGHGACRAACPYDAITLVFGTAARGVDIPHVGPDFQTNVPGVFIAGELGGMGLIRNAVEQGAQAMKEIAARRAQRPEMLDVAIIGAGPAGLAASLAAKERKLDFVTIEQESLGGTVAHFPRGKLVMTQPAMLPVVGRMRFRETTKETLLGFWTEIVHKTKLPISYEERLLEVAAAGDGFELTTNRRRLGARNILLAIGRRGTPRKLGAPGEDLDKVVYRLVDPEQYRGARVLVVGGGDSALEAAISLSEERNTTVSLSYRGDAFSRAKPKNRQRLEAALKKRKLQVLYKSTVAAIEEDAVELEVEGERVRLGNDAVIILAGGVLPTGFLKSIGVEVETKHGVA